MACIAFASGLICSVLVYLREKGSLEVLKASRRSINIVPKIIPKNDQVNVRLDEYEQALQEMYKTLGQIIAVTHTIVGIIFFSDYPTELDMPAFTYMLGLWFQVSSISNYL